MNISWLHHLLLLLHPLDRLSFPLKLKENIYAKTSLSKHLDKLFSFNFACCLEKLENLISFKTNGRDTTVVVQCVEQVI